MRRLLIFMALLCLAVPAPGADDPTDLVLGLGSPDPEVREAAKGALAAAGEEAGASIGAGLRSTNALVAAACADLVREGRLRALRGAVVDAIENPRTPRMVLRACLRALGIVGDRRDVERLCRHLREFPEAAEAIAEMGELPDSDALLVESAKQENPHPALFYAMAKLGDPVGMEGLIGALSGEWSREARGYLRKLSGSDAGLSRSDWEMWWRREKLSRSLGSGDWGSSESFLESLLAGAPEGSAQREMLLSDLLGIARDTKRLRNSRTKAILAMGLLRERSMEAPLLEILESDIDGMVRVYAAEALGRCGSAAVAVDLCYYLIFDEEPFRKKSAKGLTEPYFTVDSEVCKALADLGVAGGLDFMIRQLSAEHRVRVYHQAVSTLRRHTGQDFGFRPDARRPSRRAAAGRWRAWFDENRGSLGLSGAAATGSRLFRQRVAQLVDTLDHFHFLNMSRARQTLVLLGETALPELVSGLGRPEMHVRVHCAEILGWIHSKAALAVLASATRDRKAEVRAAAVAALGKIGPGGATEAVLRSLEDDALDVRIAAVLAMARVEREVAVPAVEAAMGREVNQGVTFQRDAHYTLAAHGDPTGVDWLSARLGAPDTAFRQLVADRIEALTGKSPGVEKESIEDWRAWWKVTRNRYREAESAGNGK